MLFGFFLCSAFTAHTENRISSPNRKSEHVDITNNRIPCGEIVRSHRDYMKKTYKYMLTKCLTTSREQKDYNFKLVYASQTDLSDYFVDFFTDYSYEEAECIILKQLEDSVNFLVDLVSVYDDKDYCSFMQSQNIDITIKCEKSWIANYILEARYDGGYVHLKFRSDGLCRFYGLKTISGIAYEEDIDQKTIRVDF